MNPAPQPDRRDEPPGAFLLRLGVTELRSRAGWIAAGYAVFATAWIYFSDRALALLVPDPELHARWSVYKGFGFVAVTTVLLLLFMRRAFGAIQRGYVLSKAKADALRASEAHLEAVIRNANDAIVVVDDTGRIVLFSAAAERMFGCAAEQARLRPLTDFLPGEDLLSGESQRVIRGRRVDGGELPLEASVSRLEGAVRARRTIILRDITERMAHETEIERLKRLYAALSHINQAIVWTSTREELFCKVCQVLVEQGGFSLAWIGWHDPATHLLEPVAVWGDETGYLRSIRVYADDRPEGRGLSGATFRSGRPSISNDLLADPATLPWRGEMERGGFRASAVFPIRERDKVAGVLNVLAGETGFFQDKEISLLAEAAVDVSFALDNLAREAERRQAEAAARTERLFSDTMLESMPGVLYFYDTAGRFLRWNRNFETVTGYSAAEIAGMHPLDFFTGEERAKVEARIGEVFARGESSVEAAFVAKDGRTTPYFFTGRRVEFEGRVCLVGVGIDITERRRAEAALRASEARYHSTLDGILEGCQLIGFDWTYLYLNDAAARHNRRPNAELLGRTMPESWPGIEATPVYRMLRRCMEERIALHDEIEFEFPDGGKAWFDVRSQPVPEGIFVLSIDISERRQAESALREAQERFAVVVENLREGLVITSRDSSLLHWNPASLRLVGFDDVEEGRRRQREFDELFELTRPDGTVVPSEQWPLARVRRGEQFEDYEVRVSRRDRDWSRILSYTGAPVHYAGGKALAFMMLSDITERKRSEQFLRDAKVHLEHEVAERTAELQTALVRAEAADRIKSAFLATMSHELRTPLNSIIGFTGIVLQGLAGPLNPEQSKQLGMVRGSARHLLDLINDVLDISKIEAGQLEVRASDFALAELIERAVASVRPMAEKKGLALTTVIAPELGAMATDRRRVEQILLNLLNNALKFTERGGVTLTATLVADYRPTPDAAPRPAARLVVADTGIGIKPADLATLFQPFRQIDSGLSRQHEGTGLGLAICRRLAGLLQGEIIARSEWARGSEFTLIIPLQLNAEP